MNGFSQIGNVSVCRVVNRVWQRAWGSGAPDHTTGRVKAGRFFFALPPGLFTNAAVISCSEQRCRQFNNLLVGDINILGGGSCRPDSDAYDVTPVMYCLRQI